MVIGTQTHGTQLVPPARPHSSSPHRPHSSSPQPVRHRPRSHSSRGSVSSPPSDIPRSYDAHPEVPPHPLRNRLRMHSSRGSVSSPPSDIPRSYDALPEVPPHPVSNRLRSHSSRGSVSSPTSDIPRSYDAHPEVSCASDRRAECLATCTTREMAARGFRPGKLPAPPPRPDVPPSVLVAVSYPYWVRLWSLRLSTCLRNTLSVRLPRAYHPSDLY